MTPGRPLHLLCTPLLLLLFGVFGQEGRAQESEREVARRVVQLESEIEALLANLSPEARDRVLALVEALKEETLKEEKGATTDASAAAPPPTSGSSAGEKPAERVADSAASEEMAPSVTAAQRSPAASRSPDAATTPTSAPPPRPLPTAPTPSPSAADPSVSESSCLPLALFDTSGDGVLSGADRLWRHFYLETDLPKNDGIVSLFELDIRSVALDVETYGVKGDAEGYIQRGSTYRFQLIGRAARRARDGLLAVDATGLARNGTVRLLDAEGNELEGFQVLSGGQTLAFASGERVSPLCR